MSNRKAAICLVAALMFVGMLQAQVPDLSGTWTLQTAARLPVNDGVEAAGQIPSPDCVFEGTAKIGQAGSAINGSAVLMLQSGPDACPGAMNAQLTGGVQGSAVSGNLDGGEPFGTATFDGAVSGDAQLIQGRLSPEKNPAQAAAGASGMFDVQMGPFMNGGGNWSAQRQPGVPVPTLGETGLALLVALLMASSVFMMRRGA